MGLLACRSRPRLRSWQGRDKGSGVEAWRPLWCLTTDVRAWCWGSFPDRTTKFAALVTKGLVGTRQSAPTGSKPRRRAYAFAHWRAASRKKRSALEQTSIRFDYSATRRFWTSRRVSRLRFFGRKSRMYTRTISYTRPSRSSSPGQGSKEPNLPMHPKRSLALRALRSPWYWSKNPDEVAVGAVSRPPLL